MKWSDIITDFSKLDLTKLYSDWEWLLKEKFNPIMMSKFGDLFYEKSDGKIFFLDTIEGCEVEICDGKSEFIEFINRTENIENYLLSHLVAELIEKFPPLKVNECYSFKVIPILGGKIEADNVEIIDLSVSLSLMGQVHFQTKDLEAGTKISGLEIKYNK